MMKNNFTILLHFKRFLLSFLMIAWTFGLNAQSRQLENINTGNTKSIAGSEITVTTSTYNAGSTVDFEFGYHFESGDMEWGKTVSLNFPTGITVNSATAIGALTYGSETGDGVLVNWGGTGHQEGDQTFTVNVSIDAGFTGDISIDWTMGGDVYGAEPHNLSGTLIISPPVANDARLSVITSPADKIVVGSEDIIVTLENNGSDNLTSVNIDWTMDGVSQTTYNWIGDLANGASEDVTIGTYNFSSEDTITIYMESSLPNGVIDENTGNDIVSKDVYVYPAGSVFETEPNQTWNDTGVQDVTNKIGIGSIESYGTDYWNFDAVSGNVLTATIICDAYVSLYLYKDGVYVATFSSGDEYNITEDGTYNLKIGSLSTGDKPYTLEVTVSVDENAPGFTSDPANEATEINISTDIELTFNELVYYTGGADLEPTNLLECFDLKEGSVSGTDVEFTAVYNEVSKQVVITPLAELEYETDYYVILLNEKIQDASANLAAEENFYFTTKAAPVVVSMPLVEGFENETFPPTNWELTGDGTGWSRETNSEDITFPEGTFGALFYNYSSPSTLRTPMIDMGAAVAPRIAFKWQNTPGYFGGLACIVNVSTDGGATFNEVYNVEATDENWINAKIDLTEFTDQTIIEFDLGNDFNSVYLDDISIAEKPTTPIFKITPENYDFGKVEITDDNNIFTFNVINDGGGTMNLTAATLTGDNAADFEVVNTNIPAEILEEAYDLEIKFNPETLGSKVAVLTLTVDGEDHIINLTGEGHDSEIKELPYIYGFEDVNPDIDEMHGDWRAYNLGGMTWCKIRAASANTGANALNLYNGSFSSGDIMAVMPVSNIDVTNTIFSFNTYISGTAGLEVGYLTDNNDPSTFVRIDSLALPGFIYTYFEIDMSEVSISGPYYLAFKHSMSGGYQSIYIDDIKWFDPSIAALSDLLVDTETVTDFDAETYSYDILLPSSTVAIPAVDAIAVDDYAELVVTQATVLPGIATAAVTTRDDATTITYTINFTQAATNDSTLSALFVDDVRIEGFDPAIHSYDIELAYGTTAMPAVTAITNDADAGKVITDITSLPGIATVVVTAADGIATLTYTVNFSIAPNTDADLFDLTVGGTTVTGFDKDLISYNVVLAMGSTEVPEVQATPIDGNANAVVTDATELPGTTSVLVTAEDNVTTKTYEINFTVIPSDDATLSGIKVAGESITDFDATTETYNIVLESGTTEVPEITVTCTSPNADVKITDATDLPGTSTIEVTAENGTDTKMYTVNFTVATGIEFAIEQNLNVYPIPSNGEFTVDLGYNIQNKGLWTLSNLSGQIVADGEIIQSRFEVRNYSKGVYILTIIINQQVVTKKIVIE